MRLSPSVLIVLVIAAWIPASAGNLKGPGPFSNIEIRDGQLILDVKQNGGTLFSGSPKVFAADRAEWLPISGNTAVAKDGVQLVQKGTVNGVPIDAFFKDGEIRRLLVRNGSGGETEVDLYRIQNGFLQTKVNRSPSRPVAGQSTAVVDDLNANQDRSLTLTLSKPESTGFDVVFAAVVPALDAGVNSQHTSLMATDTTTRQVFYAQAGFATSGSTLYSHANLPAGSYEISLLHSLEFGNPLVATGSMLFVHPLDHPISISGSSRIFEVAVPHDVIPPMQDTTINVLGLEQFDPTVGNPLNVTVDVVTTDNSYSVNIHRDALVATPLSVTIPLPDNSFAGGVSISRFPSTPNSAGHTERFGLPMFTAAPEVALTVPPVVKVSGTILDPSFALASSGGPDRPPSLHYVYAGGTTAQGTFFGSGVVSGFARGYSFYVPRGGTSSLNSLLDVALGEPVAGNDFSTNDDGTLQLFDVAGGVLSFDSDVDVDVQVPPIARHVTINGTVVDSKGRPVKFAFISAVSTDETGSPHILLGTYVGTGKDGRFSLRLPRGAHYSLTAYGRLPGY
ncbi:MAG TPA: carboxypeptidase-like regulatory domain-containing protein [Blastocatellia bacterium]|nr:carboxypeptidase-like regulatory domain-containing protein [Blastocatellia bacterium]